MFSLSQEDNNSSSSENLTFHSDESPDLELGNEGDKKTPVDQDAECMFCDGKFSEDFKGELWLKCLMGLFMGT